MEPIILPFLQNILFSLTKAAKGTCQAHSLTVLQSCFRPARGGEAALKAATAAHLDLGGAFFGGAGDPGDARGWLSLAPGSTKCHALHQGWEPAGH